MELTIYPNPVTDKTEITINSGKLDVMSAVLTDVSGNVIRHFKTSEAETLNKFYVEKQDLPSGLYHLKISSPTGDKAVKIYIR